MKWLWVSMREGEKKKKIATSVSLSRPFAPLMFIIGREQILLYTNDCERMNAPITFSPCVVLTPTDKQRSNNGGESVPSSVNDGGRKRGG